MGMPQLDLGDFPAAWAASSPVLQPGTRAGSHNFHQKEQGSTKGKDKELSTSCSSPVTPDPQGDTAPEPGPLPCLSSGQEKSSPEPKAAGSTSTQSNGLSRGISVIYWSVLIRGWKGVTHLMILFTRCVHINKMLEI